MSITWNFDQRHDRVHSSDEWKRWCGMFGIYFFIKTDMDLVGCITWIHHRKVYDISLTVKRNIDKKLPLRSALYRSIFTQPSIHKHNLDFCFNTKWNVVNLFVMNSCNTINNIHASFDEKKNSPYMPHQHFHLSDEWTRSLSIDVSDRSFKLLTNKNGL